MSEFERPFAVKRVNAAGVSVLVEANAAECAAIAKRLLIEGVSSLQCRWQLRLVEGGTIEAEGTLRARVIQLCIVTVEPFPAEIAEDFIVRFVLEDRQSEEADDPEEPDELVYDGVTLDLGEAAVEQLALALDPYPRAPGAVLADLPEDDEGGAFAALADLRKPN